MINIRNILINKSIIKNFNNKKIKNQINNQINNQKKIINTLNNIIKIKNFNIINFEDNNIYTNNNILFLDNIIFKSNNIQIKCPTLNYNKEYIFDKSIQITYLNYINNKLFMTYIDHNISKKIFKSISMNLKDPYNPIIDTEIYLYSATHNLYFFYDKNRIIKAIGGWIQYLDIDDDDEVKYNKGTYLFSIENNKFKCENNNLPIIHSENEGRYDQKKNLIIETNTMFHIKNNIKLSEGGYTTFDSLGSVVYNKKNNLYYLYHRANIFKGGRYIQYCTSSDLINWSNWNLINLNDNELDNYYRVNIYYSNFFVYKNSNICLAILPCSLYKGNNDTKFTKGKCNNMYYRLYYSYDFINFNFIDNFFTIKNCGLENAFISTNYPIEYNDNNIFYFVNYNKFKIYNIKKDRFFCITNQKNNISSLQLKSLYFKNKQIIINANVEKKGYINVELMDINNNLLEDYKYNDFNTISNIDNTEILLSWKNNNYIPYENVIVNIIFYKAEIYTINGENIN